MRELAEMTVGQIVGGVAGIAAFLSIFIEITPLKLNPISKFLAWFGKKLNGQVVSKVDEQGKKLDALDEKIDVNEIDHIRWEILDFANSCRNGRHHTQDEFEHIIKQHEKYTGILAFRGMKNGLVTLEYEYIKDIYKKCQLENSFL